MSAVLPKVCLTIAGLDPSGGAGIVADVKAFSAFGCFAAAAVTSVTFQNTTGVFGAVHQSADSVRRQVEAVLDDYDVAVIKTGMLPTVEIIETVADLVANRGRAPLVVDPVVRSTSGFDLIDDEALRALVERLFPLAAVITPNLPEAERIVQFGIRSSSDMKQAGTELLGMGPASALIKGGHAVAEDAGEAVDRLFVSDTVREFRAPFIQTTSTHGTGCILASSIAANLALGETLESSIQIAKTFVTHAIGTAPGLGRGNSPINI